MTEFVKAALQDETGKIVVEDAIYIPSNDTKTVQKLLDAGWRAVGVAAMPLASLVNKLMIPHGTPPGAMTQVTVLIGQKYIEKEAFDASFLEASGLANKIKEGIPQ
jgi:hypothetical protein